MCEICSKLTIKTPHNDVNDVILVSLFLTLNSFPVIDLEQVNAGGQREMSLTRSFTEEVTRSVLQKRCSKYFQQNSQKNTFLGVQKLRGNRSQTCNIIKKETPTKVFFCGFCETIKNTFFKSTSGKLHMALADRDEIEILPLLPHCSVKC